MKTRDEMNTGNKRIIAWSLAASGLFIAALGASAASAVVQPAAADAIVRSSSEKKNYGAEPVMELKSTTFGGVSEAYFRFDFPPTAQFCDKVLLRLYAQLAGAGTAQMIVRSVAETNWTEDTLVWKWRPEHAKALGTIQVVGVSGSWYELDLTQFAKAELVAGRKSVNFVLVPGEGAKQAIVIPSREADNHQPEMVFSRPNFTARVSFLPRGVVAPTNYVLDHGEVFAAHSRYTYGWNMDNQRNMRDRMALKYKNDKKNPVVQAPDRRYEVLAYMDNEKMTNRVFWEMAVPNGTYKVRVVAGDAQRYDSIFGLTVENVVAVEGVPDQAKHWIEGTVTIPVKDGRLTINNTPSSSNNKLCFVEITETETLISRKP
jgi:hypothetical protein